MTTLKKDSGPAEQFFVRLTKPTADRLRALSAQSGRTIVHIVESALVKYMDDTNLELPPQLFEKLKGDAHAQRRSPSDMLALIVETYFDATWGMREELEKKLGRKIAAEDLVMGLVAPEESPWPRRRTVKKAEDSEK